MTTIGIAITLERKPSKKSKKLIPNIMQRGLRMMTLQGAIENVQYCEK